MTPPLGFFYGGLVRSKNALNTMMMSVSALGFVGLAWALAGYALAFAPGGSFDGDLGRALLLVAGLVSVALLWSRAGTPFAFAPDGAFAGDLGRELLLGVGLEPQGSVPHLL